MGIIIQTVLKTAILVIGILASGSCPWRRAHRDLGRLRSCNSVDSHQRQAPRMLPSPTRLQALGARVKRFWQMLEGVGRQFYHLPVVSSSPLLVSPL